MPHRPKRACRHQGCPTLVDGGYCASHTGEERDQKRQRERWRGSPASRGYDYAWTIVRRQALERDSYLCQHCFKRGRVTPATDGDHVIPFVGLDDPLRLDVKNVESLCRSCHNVKTQQRPPQ